jgi:hypothetical protein
MRPRHAIKAPIFQEVCLVVMEVALPNRALTRRGAGFVGRRGASAAGKVRLEEAVDL